MHNPNPFDFVPFAERPYLKKPEDFDALGDWLSGYLEVKLKALTPLHIVGYQQPGDREGRSFMYRQNDRFCIPAASIRGCLRAFLEALTNGWVSQATPEYPKAYRKRHVGFRTFEPYPNRGRKTQRTSPPAVTPDFKPQIRPDSKIDVASYLFGMVIEPESAGTSLHESLARKAKIWIEDAFINQDGINDQKYWVPDIKHETQDAFMGGAKPSASNWWYLQPSEIWERRGGFGSIAEFIGGKFWGRKFYYHQNPQGCMKYYDGKGGQWNYSRDRPFYPIKLQCLEQNATTDTFRIYLDKVPQSLAVLFVLCLLPGNNIRHKLGYGKSYGYGSIEFTIEAAHLRREDNGSRIPTALQDYTATVKEWSTYAWQREKLASFDIANPIVDWQALASLARILGWQNCEKLLFTYPPFKRGDFATPVTYSRARELAPKGFTLNGSTKFTQAQAREFATKLLDIKRPIHFQVYQENAKGWEFIRNRIP